MTDNDIFQTLVDLIRETFDVDPEIEISSDTVSFDIDGWDSLSHAVLISLIERRFNITLTHHEAISAANVGELMETIRGRLG